MWRIMAIYGLALGAGATLLAWLDYKHAVRDYSTEFYVGLVALLFVGMGIWVGNRLTARPRGEGFARNDAVLRTLGISERECDVLTLIAAGDSNKLIARKLGISPNTVKTHLGHLFEKLEAANRTQAVHKARHLDILP
jgi:DNA-binding CsgD family transcriptional regulator